jgi:hypothetical protein
MSNVDHKIVNPVCSKQINIAIGYTLVLICLLNPTRKTTNLEYSEIFFLSNLLKIVDFIQDNHVVYFHRLA